MKDLRNLKKWRDALRKEFEALDAAKAETGEGAAVPAILEKTPEELEDEELMEMDKKINELKVSQKFDKYFRSVISLEKTKLKELQSKEFTKSVIT